MLNRVVVTGIGVIAPNGTGINKFWNAACAGRSGVKYISSFDTNKLPVKIAAEVNDFSPAEYLGRKKTGLLSRFAQFSLAASRMAVEDAGLLISAEKAHRTGIVIGTAVGGLEIAERECSNYYNGRIAQMNPFSSLSMNPNSAVGIIAVEMNIRGFNMTVTTGCSAGLTAISHAFDVIREGKADVVIAGGAEAPLFPVTFASFCSANVLTKRNDLLAGASRPFDRNRDGYVLGEGAGIMILESLDHALERGARIYSEVGGYAMTNDGYSVFKMEPTGQEVGETMMMAMENAGVRAEEISYINAHGSSSVVSDKRETVAIKHSMGKRAYDVPVSSIKSMVGQSLAAAAALQFVSGVMTVHTDLIPPTINYSEQDPECDLDYVPNKSRNGKKMNAVMINSFGAGGNNISMVLKKYGWVH